MKRNRVLFICLTAVVFATGQTTEADEAKKKPRFRTWDQDEAVARVKQVIAIEESGELPWDDIAWETDPAKAVARAKKENKPLFVYLYLKKNVGPATAPC